MRTNRLLARVWQVFAMHVCAVSALYAADGEVMVGGIGGELTATPTGGATYTIPIECPPGVGIQPSLSLVYNSQSGKGIAGWGWNIGGLSAITRTSQISYFEGKNKIIVWDKTDPLTLNGQRLIKESAWGTDSVSYRMEGDLGTLVKAYGLQSWGPSYLKVYTKEGITMTYGNPQDASSYTLLYTDARTQSNPVKTAWNLVEITDPNENFMKIEYVSSLNGAIGNAVRKITYGGNTRKNDSGTLVVSFDYEKRTDEIQGYLAGKESLQQLRLTKISTSVNGILQKEYQLSYQRDVDISRLVSIDLYNRGVKQVNPITFTYGEGKTLDHDTDKKEGLRLLAIDADGHGRSELVNTYIKKNPVNNKEYTHMEWYNVNEPGLIQKGGPYTIGMHNWDDNTQMPDYIFGDFNGNGTTDNIYVYHNADTIDGSTFQRINTKVADLSNGEILFEGSTMLTRKAPFYSVGQCAGLPASTFILIKRDFEHVVGYRYNYDVFSRSDKGAYAYVGSDYFTVPSPIVSASLVNLGGFSYRDDLWLTLENGANQIIVNNQSDRNWFSDATIINPVLNIGKDDLQQFIDINGDGLTDIVYRKDENTWRIAYNRGNYAFTTQDIDFITNRKTRFRTPNKIVYTEHDALLFIDVNQDGLMDIISGDEQLREIPGYDDKGTFMYFYTFGQTSWNIYLNTGTGFSLFSGAFSNLPAGCSCFADFYGKGSICWAYAADDGRIIIRDFNFNPNQNLLTGLTNSLGVTTTLQYKPQTNGELQITDNYAGSKINTLSEYQSLFYMPYKSSLSRVFSGCTDGNVQYEYNYGTPLVNWKYRGAMGSRYQEKRDVKKNISEITEYGFPVSGRDYHLMLPAFKTVYAGDNRTDTISRETYEYTIKSYPGKRYAVFPLKTLNKGYLAGETTVTQYYDSYDDYGNILTNRNEAYNQTELHEFTYGKCGTFCPNKPTRHKLTVTGKNDYTSFSRSSLYSYDERGNLTEEIADYGDANALTTRYMNYDVYGHPLRIEQVGYAGETRVSTLAYAPSGRFVSRQTNALDESVSYEWDEARSLLLKSIDRFGNTVYTYTTFDQLHSVAHPDGITEYQTPSWVQNDASVRYKILYSRTGLQGVNLCTYYDKYGREVIRENYAREALLDGYGNSFKKVRVQTEYYEDGQVYRISKPISKWGINWASTYTYDKYGRVLTEETPQGTLTTSYGANYMETVKPDGTERKEWNPAGQMIKSTVNGRDVFLSYTAGNRLRSLQPEYGSVFSMTYDLQGNCIKQTDPAAGTIQFSYDAWGQLRWKKQQVHSGSSETTTNYFYSPAGLLQKKTLSGSPTTYAYDAYNRLQSITKSGHVQSYEYDAFDRPVKVTDLINKVSFVTQKEYDEKGRISKEIYPSGYYITNQYDVNGYLKSVTDKDGSIVWKVRQSDPEGRILKEEKRGIMTEYTYNYEGQLTSIKSPGRVDMSYTYYPTGNVKQYKDAISKQEENYLYDDLDRLINWKKPTQSYPFFNIDYNGYINRITRKYDPLNGENIYSYLSSSSHTLKELSYCSLPVQNISYTDFKKIKGVNTDKGFISIEYGVDEQRIHAIGNYGLSNRYYVNDEYEEDVNVGKVHYIYGANGLAAIYIIKGETPVLYSVYSDRQGSLVALAKDSTVAQYYAYDPWGNRRDPSNWEKRDARTSLLMYRGYTMHEHIDQMGLINMNGRMYEPYTGTFLSPDPYLKDSFNWLCYNRYAYSLNNPLKYVDPTGEIPILIPLIGAVAGAYMGGVVANHGEFNPGKWDYQDVKTWGYMFGGAAIGGGSAYLGGVIGGAGIPMANTASIASASFSYSLGMNVLTGGQVPISVSLGGVSYDFSNGKFGYLGKKGNKWYENIGYGLGTLANLEDILAGMRPSSVKLRTEDYPQGNSKDLIGHSQITDMADNSLIDWGPDGAKYSKTIPGTNSFEGGGIIPDFKLKGGKPITIKNVNLNRILNYSNRLNNGGKYNLLYSSCVTKASIALNMSGVFNIGIHPYILYSQMYLRSLGLTPTFYSSLLYNLY